MYPPVPVIPRECSKATRVAGYDIHPGVRAKGVCVCTCVCGPVSLSVCLSLSLSAGACGRLWVVSCTFGEC
jgi:hypothetical protein